MQDLQGTLREVVFEVPPAGTLRAGWLVGACGGVVVGLGLGGNADSGHIEGERSEPQMTRAPSYFGVPC